MKINRINIKIFIVSAILIAEKVLIGTPIQAQNNIRVVEDIKYKQSVQLHGKAEAVFVSNSNNLFIESSRPSLDIKHTPARNASGKWEYVIEIQLQTKEGFVNGRTFTITQKGSTDKAVFSKKSFEPNNRYYFEIEETKNPIFLVDKTSPTDGHFVNGEAAVEINSIIKVDILTDSKLPCRKESRREQAGYYSNTLIINMKEYEALRLEVQRQQISYEDLNGALLERAENGGVVSDKEWNALEAMQLTMEESIAQFSDLSTIKISAFESNELLISIENLQAKQKKVYSIESTNNDYEDGRLSFTINDVKFKMVFVEGGSFTMGATKEQASIAMWDETPVRTVTLDDYYIGETEVSQTLWTAVMGINPSKYQGDNLPVENVTFEQALEFVSLLNKKTGEDFRLPTEAEWEYAARGGKESKGYVYSGSNSPNEVASFGYGENHKEKTFPIMSKKSNELGIFDMSGNVWEWCSDWYAQYEGKSCKSPMGPKEGTFRVSRGGCSSSSTQSGRVSARHYNHPTDKSMLGVRLVLIIKDK